MAGFGRDLTDLAGPVRPAPSPSPSAPPARRRRAGTPTPSTSSSCPARRPARPGPTSRSPRAVTASAASAPSRPSGASSGPARRGGAGRGRRPPRAGARRAAAARDRPRRPGPRLLRAGPLGPRPAHPHRQRPSPIAALTRAVSARVERTRLLYLYPSGLTDELIEAVLDTGVPYFDLSLQHVSRPLLAGMRRWGDGERFLRRIADIRAADPDATFRSSFILGYPGETERDHDLLLQFLAGRAARLGRLLPLLPRGGHPRRRAAGPGRRPSWPSSACASAPSCRTPSPRPSGTA